ncbi:hypothetical protein E5161_07375 [Cohnella pontilimi]|uniref:Thioredoxin domain-containing protein n=1 Tax=Cohnella pontilimi TaxID=2564100 RepID=A0A4U0FED9_9BACL|nr:thioredoxin family protein [Cohnella pontilimi]TJY42664.1 hypothetical protein E5161_07375 [Cohnella pontilimi]
MNIDLLTISNVALWIIVCVELFIMFFLTKYVKEFLSNFRVNPNGLSSISLQKGDPAPIFRAIDQNGNLIKLADNDSKITMMLFTKQSCNTCKQIYLSLPNIFRLFSNQFRFIVVTESKLDEDRLKEFSGFHFCESNNLYSKYKIEVVPTVVFIDQNGDILLVESLNNAEKLNSLIQNIARNEVEKQGA